MGAGRREYNGGMAELRWVEGDTTHKVRLETTPVGIGRASDNQLVLKDFSVSRHHAKVEPRGEAWWVMDLGSTNGVKVNGAYVSEALLADGDQLLVGNFTIFFHRTESIQNVSVSSSTFLRSIEEFREDFRLEREPVRRHTTAVTRPRARARGAGPGGAHAARGGGAASRCSTRSWRPCSSS